MLQPRLLHGREKPSFSSMTLFFSPFPPSALFAAGDGGAQQNQNRTGHKNAIRRLARNPARSACSRACTLCDLPALHQLCAVFVKFSRFFFFSFFPALMPYFGLPLAAQQPSLHSLAQRSCAQEEYLKLLGWKLGSQSSPGASFSTTLVPGVGAVQRAGSHPPSWGTAGSDPSPGPYRGGKCY